MILVLALGWLFISINTLNWLYTLISRYSLEMFGSNFVAMEGAIPNFLARLTSFILTVLMAFLAGYPVISVLRHNDAFITPLGYSDNDPLEN